MGVGPQRFPITLRPGGVGEPLLADEDERIVGHPAVENRVLRFRHLVHRAAEMHNAGQVVAMVAVCRDENGRTVVTNPCGLCRELMGHYGPDAWVLIDRGGEVVKVRSGELMPSPWNFPHDNDWDVADPTAP